MDLLILWFGYRDSPWSLPQISGAEDFRRWGLVAPWFELFCEQFTKGKLREYLALLSSFPHLSLLLLPPFPPPSYSTSLSMLPVCHESSSLSHILPPL